MIDTKSGEMLFRLVDLVIETCKKVLHPENIGDGKIFTYNVENAIKIRTRG